MEREENVLWEPGGTEAETPAGTARRHRKPLSKIRWNDLQFLLSQTVSGFYGDNTPRLGAALAFYTMLSLAPLLVVAIGVAGLVFSEEAAKNQVIWQVRELVGPRIDRPTDRPPTAPRRRHHRDRSRTPRALFRRDYGGCRVARCSEHDLGSTRPPDEPPRRGG
jgi:hypothetical protein